MNNCTKAKVFSGKQNTKVVSLFFLSFNNGDIWAGRFYVIDVDS